MASDAQIQRQLMAQQRAKFARAAKDRENRQRQAREVKQSRRRSTIYPSAPKDIVPALTMPSLGGRQSAVQVLDDIVPLADEMFVSTPIKPIPEDYLFQFINTVASRMMLGVGVDTATATNAIPQAKNENITASSIAQAIDQAWFLNRVPKWSSGIPRSPETPSMVAEVGAGLIETTVGDQPRRLENRGRDVVRIQFNGGDVVLEPGQSFVVSPEYGRMEVVTLIGREPPWSTFRGRGFNDWEEATFSTYGGISRAREPEPRPFPRRVENREDMEELESFYQKQIRDVKRMYLSRIRDLETALNTMQRQLQEAMALSNRPMMIGVDPARAQPKPDPKPSPAEIHLKNPPRKFRSL